MSTGTIDKKAFQSDWKNIQEEQKKAKAWCEKARDLLRIKKRARRDKKTVDSRELTAAIEAVEKSLGELQDLAINKKKVAKDTLKEQDKFEKLKELTGEYIKAARLGAKAVQDGNQELAKSITLELKILNENVRIECVDSPSEAEETKHRQRLEKIRAEEKNNYETALQDVKKEYAELNSLGNGPFTFLGKLDSLIYTAESYAAAAPPSYPQAIRVLGSAEQECSAQKERHEKYEAFIKLRDDSYDQKSVLLYINSSEADKAAKLVDQAINFAIGSLGTAPHDYDAGIDALKKVPGLIGKALRGMSKSEQKTLVEIVKAKKDFEEEAKKANDKIHELSLVRNADQAPAKDYLDVARRIVTRNQTFVADTDNIKDIESAKVDLGGVNAQLKLAAEAVENAKKFAERDLEALPKWQKLLRRANDSYEIIKSLPGATDEENEMMLLIGKAHSQIKKDQKGVLTTGYANAVDVLKEYENVEKRAHETSERVTKLDLPEDLKSQIREVELLIRQHSKVAPTFLTAMRWDELDRCISRARATIGKAGNEKDAATAEQAAVKDVKAVGTAVEKETGELTDARTAADKQFHSYQNAVKEMESCGVPVAVYAEFKRIGDTAEEKEMANREWKPAEIRFKQATEGLESLLELHRKSGGEWAKKVVWMDQAYRFCSGLLAWKPLAPSANNVRGDIDSMRQEYESSHDPEQCLKLLGELDTERIYAELVETAGGAGLVKESEDTTDIDQLDGDQILGLKQLLNDAHKEVSQTAETVRRKALVPLENALSAVEDRSNTQLHTQYTTTWTNWENFYDKPTAKRADIKSQKSIAVIALKDIARTAAKLLNNETALLQLSKKIQAEEEQQSKNERPRKIEEQLVQLEAYDKDISKLKKQLAVLLDPSNSFGDKTDEMLLKMQSDLTKQIQEARKEAQGQWLKARDDLNESVLGPLKKIKGRHKGFQDYQEKLEKQAQDLEEMLYTEDPYLLEIAQAELKDLQAKVAQVDPKQREEDARRYKDVRFQIEVLSAQLGTDTDRIVAKRLPDTYKDLYDQLQSAIEESHKSSPEDGYQLLQKLYKPITDAVKKARLLDEEIGRFKKRVEAVEEQWKNVRKATGTMYFDKAKSFADNIEARLADIKSTRKKETGLPEAGKMLNVLEKELSEILEGEDPRASLQQLDEKYAQAQRRIRDMGRLFEAEVDAFVDKTIPMVLNAVKEQEDGDVDTVKRLAKVAKLSKKIVGPYLNEISKVPHKKAQGNSSPDLAKAEKEFERARQMLTNAQQSARRLQSATTSTNIDVTNDLKKVHESWVTQVEGYNRAIRNVSEAIRKSAEEFSTLDIVKGSDRKLDEIKNAAEQAAKIVEHASSHFSSSAFAAPFKTLTAETDKDKKKRAAQQKKKLAAREDALRIMRQCRTDLLNHPLLTKLTDKSNPFEQEKIMAASAYVRAALKRIELETLIGV